MKDEGEHSGARWLKGGSWVATLHLMEHSPATWIDSRLVIEDPRTRSAPTGSTMKLKPTVELRMKHSEQLVPYTGPYSGAPTIIVPLESSLMANSLQYK